MENPLPPPERHENDPLTKSGKPRRRRRKLTSDERNKLIEEIRKLLIIDVSEYDIGQKMGAKWHLSPKYIRRNIIHLARKRNRSILEGTADDNLADSLHFWGLKKQNAEYTIQQERAVVENENRKLDLCDSDFDALRDLANEDNPMVERFEAIEMRRSNSIKRIDRARRTIYTAEMVSKESQREIDRLKGNIVHRHAQTDTKGRDIPVQPAPTSEAALDDELRTLVDSLKGRESAVVAAALGVGGGNEVSGNGKGNGNGAHRGNGNGTSGNGASGHNKN